MESKDCIKLYDGDDRKSGALKIHKEIYWPQNLFIVGTVNIDETTYMFSPKVLDRANVIEFRISESEMESFLMKERSVIELDKLKGNGQSMAVSFLEIAKDKKIVKTNDYGYTLESTKFIKNGCIVYTGNFYNIPNNNKLYKLIIKSSDDKEPLIFENIGNKNTVKENETTRNLYTFDGFMNHSCNYNTISSETRTTSIPNRFEYDQIAVKDIHVGDQITCNYLHFDYNCDGHIFDCLCGSSNCYGEISGFKNCSLKQQLELLPHIDKIMLEQFKRENDDILFKNISFENKNIDIFVNNNNSFFGIKSKKTFKKDEIVLENNIEQIPLDKKVGQTTPYYSYNSLFSSSLDSFTRKFSFMI
jgi:hypothetical protein